MPGPSRVVRKKNYFAWLEYQHHGDAVRFSRAFSTMLGWKNIFRNLKRSSDDPGSRQTAFDIVVPTMKYGSSSALVGLPMGEAEDFLGKWILNPGVKDNELTYDDTEDQATIVAVSGHGSSGQVWGDALGEDSGHEIDLAWQLEQNAKAPASGRMKCLIIPSCNNVRDGMASKWEPILRKANPVHFVLGYEDTYSGGRAGAGGDESLCSSSKKQTKDGY